MYTNLNYEAHGIDPDADFYELAKLAAANGIGGIDMPMGAFSGLAEAKEAGYFLAGLGLSWGLVPTPCDMYDESLTEKDFVRALLALEGIAQRAAAAGCTRAYNHIWPGSNTLPYSRHYRWVYKRARQVAGIFRDAGIHYGLECVGPRTLAGSYRHPFFNNYLGIIGFADDLDCNVGLVFDTFHWYCMGAHRDDLTYFLAHVDRVVNLHVNDAIPGRAHEEQMDLERGMPMEHGVINAAEITRMFLRAGYTGPLMSEPLNPWMERLQGMPTAEAVKTVGKQYKGFLHKVGL